LRPRMSLSGRDEIDWDPNKPGGVPDFASHPPEASRSNSRKPKKNSTLACRSDLPLPVLDAPRRHPLRDWGKYRTPCGDRRIRFGSCQPHAGRKQRSQRDSSRVRWPRGLGQASRLRGTVDLPKSGEDGSSVFVQHRPFPSGKVTERACRHAREAASYERLRDAKESAWCEAAEPISRTCTCSQVR
jgi:hypothetical protein